METDKNWIEEWVRLVNEVWAYDGSGLMLGVEA
jgi:hypothetical protein